MRNGKRAIRPTKVLRLKKYKDGFYRTSWTDEVGERHHRSFGRLSAAAATEFSGFHARWQSEPDLRTPSRAVARVTIQEAWDKFDAWARTYYRHPDGRPTRQRDNIAAAFKQVLELFGTFPADAFGPRALKQVREEMVAADLCLNVVNQRVNAIRGVFKWLVSEQIVKESTWIALRTVQALAPGRGLARETDPVSCVANRWIWAVVAAAPDTIAAMIQVQYWTGCRPGEVCCMRPRDIQTMDPVTGLKLRVWRYSPSQHKGAWRERKAAAEGKRTGKKVILLGPKAQDAIRPFLKRRLDAYMFSPMESKRQRWSKCPTHRHQPVLPNRTARRVLDHYTTNTYTRAISYICEALRERTREEAAEEGREVRESELIPVWSANQLRHTALSRLGNEFSDDLARVVAGHTSIDTTEIYLERDLKRAAEVMVTAG